MEHTLAYFTYLLQVFSNSNVLVNAPYFDGLTHRARGADGLPWWSPSQVLHGHHYCACGVWMSVSVVLAVYWTQFFLLIDRTAPPICRLIFYIAQSLEGVVAITLDALLEIHVHQPVLFTTQRMHAVKHHQTKAITKHRVVFAVYDGPHVFSRPLSITDLITLLSCPSFRVWTVYKMTCPSRWLTIGILFWNQ